MLIVEDEAILTMLLEDFLSELGCEVVATAACLSDALEAARSVRVDVALLDINLGGEQSYPVAEIMRSRKISVLFTTGYASSELPATLRETPVLNKPFTLTQLANALSAVGVRNAGS